MNEDNRFARQVAGFDLHRVLKALWHRAWAVVLAGVLTAAVLVGVALVLPPEYEASAVFYVSGENLPATDTATAEDLVDPILVILETRQTLIAVLEDLGGTGDAADLKKMLRAGAVGDTQLLDVAVTAGDADTAARIARSIVKILPERVAEIMPGVTMTLADPVITPTKPLDPGCVKLGVLGFLLGMMLSAGAITLACVLDRKVRSGEDVAALCPYPVLAEIPRTHPGEPYRLLAVKLRSVLSGTGRVIAVAGTPAEAAGLGEALTQLGGSVREMNCPENAGALEKARAAHDYVVLTLPETSAELLRWAEQADGVVLTVPRGQCARQNLAQTLDELEFVHARILGIVLTEP